MDLDVSRQPSTGRCTPEELDLLEQLRAGDRAAFQALVRPHVASLLALGRRLTGDHQWAEDLTQEALVRAFKGIGGFRGDASLRTWLFRILTRLASEPARWRRTDNASSIAEIDVPDHLGPSPLEPVMQRELRDRLDEAMERLPPRQRAALHLRAVEGLDYSSVAQALGCRQGAARMLVLAARQSVLKRMGRYLAP